MRATAFDPWARCVLARDHGLEVPEVIDLDAVFGRASSSVVEIGFGMGDATVEHAATRPDLDFVAVDVHLAGIAHLSRLVTTRQLGNVRIARDDGTVLLEHSIADGVLEAVHVFFPDPWPKASQRHRRLVQRSFVDVVVRKLRVGGYLWMATDWRDYADQMREACSGAVGLHPLTGAAVATRVCAPRVPTKYERLAALEGRTVTELVYVRV